MESWLVAYDICDPKRLRKVAQTCEDFGPRRQNSVFLCRLDAIDLVRLMRRLYDIINLLEDQVLFFAPLQPLRLANGNAGPPHGSLRRQGRGDCDVISRGLFNDRSEADRYRQKLRMWNWL
jgi:CRISPR-associated protein Cas2